MINIKVSKSFSAIVIGIVVVVFLIPSLLARFSYERGKMRIQEQSNFNAQLIGSVEQLGAIDDGLKNCITSALNIYRGLSPDRRTIANAFQLKTLACNWFGIASIDGLEQLEELQYLDLSGNLVSNLDALLKLPALEGLFLRDIRVDDLSTLSKLSHLAYLMPPSLENIKCAEFETFLETVDYTVSNADHARSTCSTDTDSVAQTEQTKDLLSRGQSTISNETIQTHEFNRDIVIRHLETRKGAKRQGLHENISYWVFVTLLLIPWLFAIILKKPKTETTIALFSAIPNILLMNILMIFSAGSNAKHPLLNKLMESIVGSSEEFLIYIFLGAGVIIFTSIFTWSYTNGQKIKIVTIANAILHIFVTLMFLVFGLLMSGLSSQGAGQ